MVIVYLADGFEEAEAIVPIDMLRRAGVEVVLAGVGKTEITGSHHITVHTDTTADKVDVTKAEMIVLPGGPGREGLKKSADVKAAIRHCIDKDILIGAICGAPEVLGEMGLLAGRKGTCFPGCEPLCEGMICTGEAVTVDGKLVTSKGAGTAYEFAFTLIEMRFGKKKAKEVAAAVQYTKEL